MTLPERITEIETKHSKAILVSKRLFRPHVLVLRAKAYLDKKSPSKWQGFEDAISTPSDYLSISVTKKNVSRALRIMDTLIKLLEKRGHLITIAYSGTRISIKGEDIQITCREKCNRRQIQTERWSSSALVPNGKLSIKIVESYSTKEWVDGYDLLENKIAQIIAELELRADAKIAQKARWEIARQEQARLQAIKDRELAMAAWEEKKVELLLTHSGRWRKAQELQAFLVEVDRQFSNSSKSKKVQDWIGWARDKAEFLNPLNGGVEGMVGMYDYSD